MSTPPLYPSRLNYRFLSMLLLAVLYYSITTGQTPIDLSRPVGLTAGVAGGNSAGAATYSIPIEVPSGIKGMQPSVSVNYSSQGAGNGYCGHGWSAGHFSKIGRAGKTNFNNGYTIAVNYTGSNDVFVLDGQRLMVISGTNGADGAVYGTEQEGFSKIESFGGDGNSPTWFKITTKKGNVLEYGTDNSKLLTDDGSQTVFWALRKVTDASGNYMLYNYDIDNTNRYYSLASISYGGNSNTNTPPAYVVDFSYTTKTDWQSCPVYISGSSLFSAKLLDKITIKKSNNDLIRSYDFVYQYRQKKYFLTSVTEAGANGTHLNPVSFTYGENPGGNNVTSTAISAGVTMMSGDFDGNGIQDIQQWTKQSANNPGDVYLNYSISNHYSNHSTPWSLDYKIRDRIFGPIPPEVLVVATNASQKPVANGDFDGDGKDDVLMFYSYKVPVNQRFSFHGVRINYSRRLPGQDTLTLKSVWYPFAPGEYYAKDGGSMYAMGDFDGNGYLDYILILTDDIYNATGYKGYLVTPALNNLMQEISNFGVNGASGSYPATSVAAASSLLPVDFDGDGKSELLVVRQDGSYLLKINGDTVSGFTATQIAGTAEIKDNYPIYPGDFNGDGNNDFLVRAPGYTSPWKICFSTGISFDVQSFTSSQTIVLDGDGFGSSHVFEVGDYDGDGKTDIWHSADNGADNQAHHYLYFSNGRSFNMEEYLSPIGCNTEAAVVTGDLNGDGKNDFLIQRSGASALISARPFKEENLLASVSNGGYATDFNYTFLNKSDTYQPATGSFNTDDLASSTPVITTLASVKVPMHLLTALLSPNGLGGQTKVGYAYEDLILHNGGRGILGFKKNITAFPDSTYAITTQDIDTTYSLIYPLKQESVLNSSIPIEQSQYIFIPQPLTNGRFFIKNTRSIGKNFLTNASQEQLNDYDLNGNITVSTVKKGLSDGTSMTSVLETTVASTTYTSAGGFPYASFPSSVTTSNTRNGQPQVSKTSNITYTAQGLPETVTDYAGTAIATVVTNSYNDFGMPAQVSINAPGVTTPVTDYVYDVTGKFLLEKKVTGDGITKKETYTYDDRWGTPLTATSADGLTTTYAYDEFGDLAQMTYPDGNIRITTKHWFSNYGSLYYIKTTGSGGDGDLDSYSYVDVLGREVYRQDRWGVYGGSLVNTLRVYNNLGQLTEYTPPYDGFEGEPANKTTYTYDSYGRLSATSNTTGTVTTTHSTSGGNFTVQTTNAAGQFSGQTTDASGKVISSSDNGNTMAFTYDSWGNQLTASSGGQTFVTNVYDSYGRRSSATDVNAGTITYQYNALGQITRQTDASGNVQTMSYDVFGRTDSTTGSQGTTTYSYYYDAGSGRSNDNITQVTGFSGDVTTYSYDALQRLSSETITASGSSLTKTYTYDSRGNLATTTYPAGFTIRNEYDINSNALKAVKYENGSTVKTLFYANALNSRGVYTNYTKASGSTTEVTYDFNKEVANRYYTWGIQDLNLSYELYTNNLLSRSDSYKGNTETFTYDADDRLTGAVVNGSPQFTMSYDAGGQGKILQKTGVGNYNYHSSKIHLLQSLSAIGSEPNPNLTMGPQTYTIAFTAYQQPQTVTHNNGYQLSYQYGAGRHRLSSELKYSASTVETKSYWGEMEGLTKGGISYEIYYIHAGNGLNNIIVKHGSSINIYDVYTDQLGSIVTVTDEAANIIAEQNFDAWGKKRNPASWTYGSVPAVPGWLYRGFTGHEQAPELGLINMNARLYDATTAQMLAPDNYVQYPGTPAGYNRYQYASSNPLKYTDPTGWLNAQEWSMAQEIFHRTFVMGQGYGGYVVSGGGSGYHSSEDAAFGSGVAHMNEHNLWGAYPGYARSPWAAMYSYTKMHGGSGRVTASMWNGYMQTKWAGYAYDLSTISKTSSKSGVGFQTIGSTYENLNLGGVVATFFTYSKAESMFLGGQQSSGNWYSPAGQSNWGLSAVALGLEHTPGSFRLGTTKLGFSPKYYGNAWRGNQYAKTFNIGKIGKGLGIAGAAVGVIADGVGLRTYYNDPNSLNAISPGKFGLNLGMTGLGFTGIGTVPSVLYFGVDAFYPGGWEGYIRDDVTNWTNMRYECNCDPSVGLYLP